MKLAGMAFGRRAEAPVHGGVEDTLEAPARWDWPHARLRETLDELRNLCAEELLERYERGI
jgi:hypothetical protein